MLIMLPDYVKYAARRLEAAGFESYVVGGAVRDALLGRTPCDWDIATSALPEQTEALFSDRTLILAGKKHGTVAAMFGNERLEMTTFRSDGGYTDRRHPDAVSFSSSIETDLARRDFTVNAMAWNEKRGLVDPFGGQEDLERRLIRAVGNPEKRFSEDALRILRCFRFAARLGFGVEKKTKAAAFALANNIGGLSAERVRDELSAFIVSAGAGEQLAENRDIWFCVIPELAAGDGFLQRNPHHRLDVFAHTLAAVDLAPPTLRLRLAALLHDVAKPWCFSVDEDGHGHFYGHPEKSAEAAQRILLRLRFPNRLISDVCRLISAHNMPRDDTDECARTWIRACTPALAGDALMLVRCDCLAHDASYYDRLDELERLKKRVDAALLRGDCVSLSQLAVNGGELRAVGLSGPDIGRVLRALLDAVMAGRIPNEHGALLGEAKRLVASSDG